MTNPITATKSLDTFLKNRPHLERPELPNFYNDRIDFSGQYTIAGDVVFEGDAKKVDVYSIAWGTCYSTHNPKDKFVGVFKLIDGGIRPLSAEGYNVVRRFKSSYIGRTIYQKVTSFDIPGMKNCWLTNQETRDTLILQTFVPDPNKMLKVTNKGPMTKGGLMVRVSM